MRCQPPSGVLFVDDEPKILKALTRVCRSENYRAFTASSAEEALNTLADESIQVVVSDQQMPSISGVALLSQVRERFPETVQLLLTGYTEQVAVDAINSGQIYRLLTKPWNDDELRAVLRQALETGQLRAENEQLRRLSAEQQSALAEANRSAETIAQGHTRALTQKDRELRMAHLDTVKALVEAVNAKDPYTRGHSERVAVYATYIAKEMKRDRDVIERIYLSALLHDIGKIGTPDAVLHKPGPLTPEEITEMQRHPEIGARILEPLAFLTTVVPCVRHHHEWYDGSDRGYPDRLAQQQIPFPSRVILVADTVDAMSSDRPYRKGLGLGVVAQEIEKFSGSQFDPVAATAFLSVLEREGDEFLERASKFDIDSILADAPEPE